MKTRLYNISYRVTQDDGELSMEFFYDIANERDLPTKEKALLASKPKAFLYIYEIAVPTVPLI